MSVELWKFIFDWATVVLIALTVVSGAGALITGGIIAKRQDARLYEFDKDLTGAKLELGKQQERAAQAEKSAAEAKQLASGFETEIAKSNERAAEANSKAEGFRLDIAKANEHAASANETAEREKLARIQLEARLADRTLTPEQRTRLINDLSSSRGAVVDAVVFGDTGEIEGISIVIFEALRSAGWTVQTANAGGGSALVRGILIGTRANADAATMRAASALIASLQSMGIAADPWDFDKMPLPAVRFNTSVTGNASIRIFVGSKP
jgi:hypothetical protein